MFAGESSQIKLLMKLVDEKATYHCKNHRYNASQNVAPTLWVALSTFPSVASGYMT